MFSVFALVALFPFLIVITIATALTFWRTPFFTQKRPGYKEKPFLLIKFRTMIDRRDAQGSLLPDADRLVPFGHFLRRTSLDEFPEFFNVLKGDMSFVGPRPLLMEYLGRYTPEQSRRHTVKPGITGWAQVNGRNGITWEQKFKFDIWYVDHKSFGVDMKILAMTLWKMIRREGINQLGHATMEEFLG